MFDWDVIIIYFCFGVFILVNFLLSYWHKGQQGITDLDFCCRSQLLKKKKWSRCRTSAEQEVAGKRKRRLSSEATGRSETGGKTSLSKVIDKGRIHCHTPHQNSSERNVKWGHPSKKKQTLVVRSSTKASQCATKAACGQCICICVYVSVFTYARFPAYIQVVLCICILRVCLCVRMCVCVWEIRWAHCSTMNGNHTAPSRQPCVTYWNPNKRWSVIVHTHTYISTHTLMHTGTQFDDDGICRAIVEPEPWCPTARWAHVLAPNRKQREGATEATAKRGGH